MLLGINISFNIPIAWDIIVLKIVFISVIAHCGLHPFPITSIFSMDNLTAAVSMGISYLETLLNTCRMN